jgi:hypothetical protein
MLKNRCASVKMEEGYMRATIEYTESSCRSIICDAIDEVEREMDIHPEVIHRRLKGEAGTFCVEFGGCEDYNEQRESGEFIEILLKKLEITQCDCS